MKQIFDKIIGSFESNKDGFSARKLVSFTLMLNICYIHYKFIDLQNALNFLIVDLCGVLICLGIVTMQQVIELKNGNTNNPPPPTQP